MLIYGSGLRIGEAVEKIQEILNKGLEKYIEKNKVIGYKQKVIKAIKDCKTEKMGGHYHVVFTIPSEIYNITYQNQEKMYKILFKASSETLQELAKDKKYLGGEVGFFSILHTWGQNLMYHPHVHIVVTGGGLTETNKWEEKEEVNLHEYKTFEEAKRVIFEFIEKLKDIVVLKI